MSRLRIRLGDVFAVPLGDGTYGYVQYVAKNDKRGPLIRAFDLISNEPITNVDVVRELRNRFPPILANFWAEAKNDTWLFVGRLPTPPAQWPLMIANNYNYKIKKRGAWYLIDANHDHRLGDTLPQEYRHLEPAIIWSAEDVAYRIRTGEYKDWPWRPDR